MRALHLLLIPPIACVALLFVGGMILIVLQSMGIGVLGDTTLFAAYRYLLSDPTFYSSLLFTTLLALVTTALATLGGVTSALLLRRYAGRGSIVNLLYQFPISLPHLVVAICVLLYFTQSGLISRLLHALGLITEPYQFPALVYDRWGVGILIVYLFKEIPFVGLIALSALQSLSADYESMARSLGATRGQCTRHVLLPLIIPAIVPASIIIFAFIFGAYEVPYFLGSSYPSMLSVLGYRYFTDVNIALRPVALALNIVIALVVLALVFLYRRIVHYWEVRR